MQNPNKSLLKAEFLNPEATMHSPSPSPSASPSPTNIKTTISNSVTNLKSTLSRLRPWSELLPPSSISLPSSLTSTLTRLKKNSTYFAINHALITTLITALFLITAPFQLIIIFLTFACWLIFYFFRNQEENPLVLSGGGYSFAVGDTAVLVVLCLVSALVVWWSDVEERLVYGVGVGLCVCVLHGVLRSTEGLFLDEDEAVTAGLVNRV